MLNSPNICFAFVHECAPREEHKTSSMAFQNKLYTPLYFLALTRKFYYLSLMVIFLHSSLVTETTSMLIKEVFLGQEVA